MGLQAGEPGGWNGPEDARVDLPRHLAGSLLVEVHIVDESWPGAARKGCDSVEPLRRQTGGALAGQFGVGGVQRREIEVLDHAPLFRRERALWKADGGLEKDMEIDRLTGQQCVH